MQTTQMTRSLWHRSPAGPALPWSLRCCQRARSILPTLTQGLCHGSLVQHWNLLGICLDVPMVVLFIALTSLTTSRNDSEWCTNCARSCYVRGRVSRAASIQKLPGFCSPPSFLHFLHMPAFCQALNIMKRWEHVRWVQPRNGKTVRVGNRHQPQRPVIGVFAANQTVFDEELQSKYIQVPRGLALIRTTHKALFWSLSNRAPWGLQNMHKDSKKLTRNIYRACTAARSVYFVKGQKGDRGEFE